MSEMIENKLREAFGEAVLDSFDVFGTLNIRINKDSLVDICRFLHDEQGGGFNYLADLTPIDWQDKFEIIYQLRNLSENTKITIRTYIDRDNAEVDSVIDIWSGADLQEREAYDLMGIHFNGHPDLRRILLPEDWVGHPLRKDYDFPT
ncbi:MAG: NADH-quinone oxidoreductase subunit C [Armatimonadota bacterium]